MSLAGLSVAHGSEAVTLAWDPNPESDIAGYRVHYGTASGDLGRSLFTDTNPTAVLTDLEPATTYFCAVQAFNTSGIFGPLSSEISFTIPGVSLGEISIELLAGGMLIDGQGAVEMGSVPLGSAGESKTFLIKNVGTGNLSGLAITSNSSEVSVAALAATSLLPGESITFDAVFRPTAEGSRSASIRIISNDADENPFDIALTGSGIGTPHLSVKQSSGSNLVDLATTHLGSVNVGSTGPAETYIVTNIGTTELSGLAVTLRGASPSDFTLQSTVPRILSPGEGAVIRVAFRPTSAGPSTAVLHIASNDPVSNPFEIALNGIGVALPAPILALETSDGIRLSPVSSVFGFENVIVGSTSTPQTCIVRNLGTAPLNDLQVIVTGTQGSSFVLVAPPVTSLAPGAATEFTVRFTPTIGGKHIAAVRVSSSSAPLAAFEIALGGVAIAVPEIEVLSDASSLISGAASADFGSTAVGTTSSARTFTIRNLGTAPLTDLTIASRGSHAADFTLGRLETTALLPGASTTFSVAFKPKVPGSRDAWIAISSNDADERLFKISLNGSGLPAPEIKVSTSSKNLKDDIAFVTFGAAESGTKGKTQTFTIRNTGTAKLSGLALSESGIHASHFLVSALRTKSLAPGASTTINVTFKPKRTGTSWAAIRIASNDIDEKSFDIILIGDGKRKSALNLKKKKKKKKLSRAVKPSLSPSLRTVNGIEVIGGQKFRTLTITKTSGENARASDVEVSSDLVDWSSGRNHTTVLINSATTLKVRDNTPVTVDEKRYIRVHPDRG